MSYLLALAIWLCAVVPVPGILIFYVGQVIYDKIKEGKLDVKTQNKRRAIHPEILLPKR
jgi:hypothetical protein